MCIVFRQRITAAILASLCSLGAGCSSSDELRREDSGVEGTLHVVISDLDNGTSETTYIFERDDGARLVLETGSAIDIPGETRVRVYGSENSQGHLVVTGIQLVVEAGQALVGLPAHAPYRVLALMVSPAGVKDTRTVADIQAALFGNTTSSHEYYKEESYGLAGLTGDVHDWLAVPAMSGCNYDTLATNARAAATAAGIDLTKYQQVMYYFPKTSACAWSGLAYIGRPSSPGRDSFFNGATGCVFHHELGHNYGMRHARSYSCQLNGAGTSLASAANCTFSEYGDRFDSMGSSCFQHSSYRKAAEGWFGKCNGISVSSSGTFELVPLELPSNSAQTLRVKVDNSLCPSDVTNCYYYVEYRQNLGLFDRSNSTQVYSGALIRLAGAADYTGNGSQTSTYLLDMTPTTTSTLDPALGVGKSYTDPAGTSITVVAATAAAATVRVELPGGGSGTNLCIDGSPASTGGAGTGGAGGAGGAGTGGAGGIAGTGGIGGSSSSGGATSGACATGSVAYAGHCYWLSPSSLTFAQAQSTCAARGGGWRLAEIGDSGENSFVSSLVGINETWLGATDQVADGVWSWQTGAQFWQGAANGTAVAGAYTNWLSGEPNGGTGSACMRIVSGGSWRDTPCANAYRAACESGF